MDPIEVMLAWGGRFEDQSVRRSEVARAAVSAPDVIIVGGGAIGLAIAWRASAAGLAVTVIEESAGRGASWAAAGMLAAVTEAHFGEEELLELNLESSRRYAAFVAELEELTGMSTGYAECGTLLVAPDADDYAAISELIEFQEQLGLKVERLTRRELRALEPGLAPGVRGGAIVEGDHHVDNRALVDTLHEACRLSGVDLRTGRVHAISVGNERVTGVELADGGTLASPRVVVAAGCWSGEIAGIPDHARLPVRPVKGQLLYLRGPSSMSPTTRNIRSVDIYVVPRDDGRFVIGATVEEMGWDTTVTAEAVYKLLRDAHEVLPGIGELELIECVAGLRPGSPDNAPMIGETGIDGLIAATGHYRNGILLTPITADAITELMATGNTPAAIAGFSPRRFSNGDRS